MDDLNEHELEEFHENEKLAFEACVHLLQDLSVMELTVIAILCTQARALSCLNDIERYFKNVGLRRTIESLLNSLAAIAQAEETLKLSQPTSDLEAFMVAFEAKVVNLK